MGRNEKRQQAREETQMQKWFNSWTPRQMRFHKEMVTKSIEEVEKITEQVLDSCFISAMIQYLDLELNECIEVAKLANENMQEVKEIINKDGERYFNMLKDEKLRSQIRKEAKEMLKDSQVMSEGVNALKKYYKVPVKDLTIIWAEAKEEIKKEKEIPKISTGKLKATLTDEGEHGLEILPYTVTEKEIEANRVKTLPTKYDGTLIPNARITDLPLETLEKVYVGIDCRTFKPSKLKIIEQTIKVEGQYGIYIKTTEGVKTEKIFVKDTQDLEEYKKRVISEYEKGKEEFNKRIEELQEATKELDKRADKNFAIIEEIRQVFNL